MRSKKVSLILTKQLEGATFPSDYFITCFSILLSVELLVAQWTKRFFPQRMVIEYVRVYQKEIAK